MAAILAFLVSGWTWLGSTLTAIFVGWKGIILASFLLFLGINLYNLFCEIVGELASFITTMLASRAPGVPGSPSLIGELFGTAAYLAIHLKLIEQFNFMISIVTLKWVVVKIPFLKW